MLVVLKANPEIIHKILAHLSSSAIPDIILKLCTLENTIEGQGTVEWLNSLHIIETLTDWIKPNGESEVELINV